MTHDEAPPRTSEPPTAAEVVVVGGGLAGLTAAATATRAGASVVVVEARSTLGGRARTTDHDGYLLNEGAHALYEGGVGMEVLAELGIHPTGSRPDARGWGHRDGTLRRLPISASDALRTRLVSTRAKAQLGRLMLRPGHALGTDTEGRSAGQWIREQLSDPDARATVAALARVATYCGDLEDIDAEAVVGQVVQAATHGVRYLDGGWATLVDGLRDEAIRAGATVLSGRRVTAVDRDPGSVVVGTDGGTVVGRSVVLASGGPQHCTSLLGPASPTVAAWAGDERPCLVAALDLGLSELPRPDHRFVLGLDQPTYLSVHSTYARLAPEGRHVVHLLWYGDPGRDPRPELEALLDTAQPGWRDVVVATQYGRMRAVTHGRPRVGAGLAGRPTVAVPDLPGVFVAGDWVGPDAMLAEAALSSGRAAGRAAVGFAAGDNPERLAVAT